MWEQYPHQKIGKIGSKKIEKLRDYCLGVGIDNSYKRNETVFAEDDCRVLLPITYGKTHDEQSLKACNPILKDLQKYSEVVGRVPYRIELSFVRPNSKVYPHIDKFYFHSLSRRVHVVLKSAGSHYSGRWNDLQETCIMQENDVWIINNRTVHEAENKSDAIRIHMIVDYVTPESYERLMGDEQLARQTHFPTDEEKNG